MMQIRSVPAARGWGWIVEGFRLFRKSPLAWLVLNVLLFGVIWLLDHVPVAGAYIFYLLAPIFLAGMMAACRDLEQGRRIEVAHLFRGFRENTPQLVTIGGVHLVGQVLVSGLMSSIGGPEMRDVMQEGGEAAAHLPPELRGRIVMALAVSMPVYLLLGMAMWFAPVLAMLDGQSGPRALLLSVKAILRNLLPFLVYSLASSALLVLALIPMGAGLILWFPVMILTMYASWRDVFQSVNNVNT